MFQSRFSYIKLSNSDALGLILIFYMALLAFLRFNPYWDQLAYHLPFAAARTGIITKNQFVLTRDLSARLQGFPAFVDLFQGILWWITGRPSGANLAGVFSILFLCLYIRIYFSVSIIWTALIFTAVPILQSAIDSAYTDIWTNAFFSIHLFSAYKGLLSRRKDRIHHSFISIFALGISVNSKEQYFVIGALSYGLFAIAWLVLQLRDRNSRISTSAGYRHALIFVVLGPLAFFGPIRNLVLFHNPIFPEEVKILGHRFPGTEKPEWFGPNGLRNQPQIVRFILSELDLDAINRPGGYTIDQGENVRGAPGYRMGGSFSLLFMMVFFYLSFVFRRVSWTPEKVAAASVGIILAMSISFFPGSDQLRYFSFLEISAIIATIYGLQNECEQGDLSMRALSTTLKALLVTSSLYIGFITHFSYLLARPRTAQSLTHTMGIRKAVKDATDKSDTICYLYNNPFGFLYAYYFNKSATNQKYKVIEVRNIDRCPNHSVIIK